MPRAQCSRSGALHRSRDTHGEGSMTTLVRKVRGRPFKPANPGRPPGSKNKVTQMAEQTLKNRILLENYYLPGDLEGLCGRLQPPPLSREHQQSNPGRRLLRTPPDHPAPERKDQTPDHRPSPLAAPTASRVTSSTKGARASLNWHCSLSQKL